MYWMLLRSFKNDKHGIISKVHFKNVIIIIYIYIYICYYYYYYYFLKMLELCVLKWLWKKLRRHDEITMLDLGRARYKESC